MRTPVLRPFVSVQQNAEGGVGERAATGRLAPAASGLSVAAAVGAAAVIALWAGWSRDPALVAVGIAGVVAVWGTLERSRRRAALAQKADFERLHHQAAVLTDAVDALGDGFVLYDADDRVALTNRKYRELHAANALAVEPGARFEDLFRAALMCGEVPLKSADIDAHLRERLAQHRNPRGAIERYSGGQWLRISERRTVDGGTVGIHADITGLKAAQATAEAAEDLLRDAVDCISEGFVICDAADRLVMCNQRYKDLYPKSAAAIIPGARFEDILRTALACGEILDAVGREEEWLTERLRHHRSGSSILQQRLYDGRWLLIVERKTRAGGIAGMRFDITDLKTAEAEAEAARARMTDFAEMATDWFWEADADGNLTYLSEPFEAATGISVASRIGSPRLDLNRGLDPDNPNWDSHLMAVAGRQPFRDFVMTVRWPQGVKHLSVSGIPIFGYDGRYLGYRGTTRNVTLRFEAQRTLAQRNEELAATAQKLLVASQAKSLFLANMSHELRTPLNAILGFSEVMRDAQVGPLDARYRDYARDIHAAGQHLLRIVNDVLDTSKMEAGQFDLNEESFSFVDVVDECRRLVEDKAKDGKVELSVVRSDDELLVFGDRVRIKQALLNVLSNAVKFTGPGGSVKVSITQPELGGIAVLVTDTGIGMRPDEIPVALEPFQQVDKSLARRYEGTGLGLPLAKAFVELHGGSLEIESEANKGTTVRVWLPHRRDVMQGALAIT